MLSKCFIMKKTKLLLQFNVCVKEYNFEQGHNCTKYGCLQDEVACKKFHNSLDLEIGICKDIKMPLLYISGYITRKVCSTE